MASVEHRFAAIERSCPHHSSLIVFVRAVEGQPVSKRRLVFLFRKLVDQNDYGKGDMREIVDWVAGKIESPKTATQKQGFFGERATKMTPKTRSLVWAD